MLNRVDKTIDISTWHTLWNLNESEANGQPQLRLKHSQGNQITIEITKESHGMTPVRALQNASDINYSFSQKDSLLILDPFYTFNKEAGWRNQKVFIILGIPEDKIAVLDKNVKRNLNVRWNNEVKILEQ